MKEKLMKVKQEMREFIRSKTAKYAATASAMVAGLSVAACAEETGTGAAVDFSPVTSALSSAVSVGQILALVGTIVGVGAVFFFAWFGARKLVGAFQAALKNGKIKV